MRLRVLVPLIQNIQFLIRRRTEIFHAGDNLCDTRSARTVETPRLHLDTRLFAGLEQKFTVRHIRGGIGR